MSLLSSSVAVAHPHNLGGPLLNPPENQAPVPWKPIQDCSPAEKPQLDFTLVGSSSASTATMPSQLAYTLHHDKIQVESLLAEHICQVVDCRISRSHQLKLKVSMGKSEGRWRLTTYLSTKICDTRKLLRSKPFHPGPVSPTDSK